jgi:hypothetical protein
MSGRSRFCRVKDIPFIVESYRRKYLGSGQGRIAESYPLSDEEREAIDSENEEREVDAKIGNFVNLLNGLEDKELSDYAAASDFAEDVVKKSASENGRYVVLFIVDGWDEIDGPHCITCDDPNFAKRTARKIEREFKKTVGSGEASNFGQMMVIGPDGNVLEGCGTYDYFDQSDDWPDMFHAYGD